jgi:ParB family chromosome partitioning protein
MPALDVRTVTLEKLTPDPDQVRKSFDKKGIDTLAANLKQRGVLVPLLVRQVGKKLILVDGERRYRAAKVAKLKTVPVIVVESPDDVQRAMDQVAMNSLREPLKPLELGRLLVSMRKEHKLSDNQIAAHLDKQGIPALLKGQMAELMRLVDLPAWAQGMVDEGQLEAGHVGPLLAAAGKDPKVVATVEKGLRHEIDRGGRIREIDLVNELADAYHEDKDSRDLEKTWAYGKGEDKLVVHFNSKKACAGCEHLRVFGHRRICRNPKHFDELNAQAKEAGLRPGGHKPEKPAARPGPKETAVIEARKVELYEDKLRKLVHARLQDHLVEHHVSKSTVLADKLMLWLAAGQPDGQRYGRQWYSHGEAGHRSIHEFVQASPLTSLTAFLENPAKDLSALSSGLGCAAVRVLTWGQVQALAMHLEVDLAKVFAVDADYLALQSLDQLNELGRLGGVDDANRMTGKALRNIILGDPDVTTRLGVPADVMRLYSAVPEPEPEYEDDDVEDAELDEHQDTLDEAGDIEEQEDQAA